MGAGGDPGGSLFHIMLFPLSIRAIQAHDTRFNKVQNQNPKPGLWQKSAKGKLSQLSWFPNQCWEVPPHSSNQTISLYRYDLQVAWQTDWGKKSLLTQTPYHSAAFQLSYKSLPKLINCGHQGQKVTHQPRDPERCFGSQPTHPSCKIQESYL